MEEIMTEVVQSPAASPSANPDLKWYVVHAYSGMEKAVERNILERINRSGMQNKFGRILVPTEEVVEIRNGQKKTTERKFFPGYVLVEMVMDDETWHLVKHTNKVTGFFSLSTHLIAVRDPHGNHPLSIGKSGTTYFVSSETCAFPSLDAQYVGEVEPGTMVTFPEHGEMTVTRYANPSLRQCVFELVYYGHPSSKIFGRNVGRFRVRLGRQLEEEFGVPSGEIVVGIPDSSNYIARGYGESGRSGEHYPAINRHHYVGRTFIAATQAMRDLEVSNKFTFSADDVAGKIVVLIDDSIVRGTTLINVIGVLRRMGAREVHVRIASPPFKHPCRLGINTKTYEELIANNKTLEEIRAHIDADSLQYLSLGALKTVVEDHENFCFACMDGSKWYDTIAVDWAA
jgi:amidophosphoribosyltransferase